MKQREFAKSKSEVKCKMKFFMIHRINGFTFIGCDSIINDPPSLKV